MLALQADGERLPRRVSADVLERFAQCRWPGNLRQLANVLRTASIMAEGAEQIELDDLPEDFLQDCVDIAAEPCEQLQTARADSADFCNEVRAAAQTPGQPASSKMEAWQATLITQTLERLGGNVSAAARELGLARNTVYRYLRRNGTTH
jgi:transcriptional regulator of acetoin/glycerol metabolism